jgi:hypothetical protein
MKAAPVAAFVLSIGVVPLGVEGSRRAVAADDAQRVSGGRR